MGTVCCGRALCRCINTLTHINNYTFSIHTFTHTLGTYLINININIACWQPYLDSRAAPAGSSRLRAKLTDGRACSHAISLSKLQDIWRLFDSPRRSSPTLQPPPYLFVPLSSCSISFTTFNPLRFISFLLFPSQS